jgi:hypothetical protein
MWTVCERDLEFVTTKARKWLTGLMNIEEKANKAGRDQLCRIFLIEDGGGVLLLSVVASSTARKLEPLP